MARWKRVKVKTARLLTRPIHLLHIPITSTRVLQPMEISATSCPLLKAVLLLEELELQIKVSLLMIHLTVHILLITTTGRPS